MSEERRRWEFLIAAPEGEQFVAMTEHRGQIYVATASRVYRLDLGPPARLAPLELNKEPPQ